MDTTTPAALDPLAIATHPAFAAGGERSSKLFDALAAQHGADPVGFAWIQACLAVDQGAARLAPLVDHGADMRAQWKPTDRQLEIAAAILAASPGAYAVLVPLALPGKQHGTWQADQEVEAAPGFFLAETNGWDGPMSYAAARNAAADAARSHLNAREGTSSHASIHSDGHWAVFED